MLVALAVLTSLSASVASPDPHGETPAELEVARERRDQLLLAGTWARVSYVCEGIYHSII